jgi:hypothetical protein
MSRLVTVHCSVQKGITRLAATGAWLLREKDIKVRLYDRKHSHMYIFIYNRF